MNLRILSVRSLGSCCRIVYPVMRLSIVSRHPGSVVVMIGRAEAADSRRTFAIPSG